MGIKIPLTPKNGWYHGIKSVIPFVTFNKFYQFFFCNFRHDRSCGYYDSLFW